MLRLPDLPRPDGPIWREVTLVALVLFAVASASFSPLWDPDSYWHLAVGREIWTTGHLVHTETFSFTAHGVPWEDTEWLFHLIAYPIWQIGGEAATGIFTAFVAALSMLLLYRAARLTGGDAAAYSIYSLLMLGAFVSRARFRPDLLSLLLFAVLVEALLRWKPSPPEVGRFWLFLAILFCIWAQCHGGWTFGMALLGARLMGEFLDSFREGTFSWRYARNLVLTGLSPCLAIFVNPYTWRIPWFPIKSLIGFSDPTLAQIAEWQHTPFRGVYGIFLSLCAGILVLLLARWRSLEWRTWLVAASQVFLGWYWGRYAAFAVLALLPPLLVAAGPWLKRPHVRRFTWGSALLGAVVVSAVQVNGITTALDLSKKYPVQEAAFLKANDIRGNIYNVYTCGGYLGWTLYPECRIFMDGRYYPFIAAIRDYWNALVSVRDFRAFTAKTPFDIVLYPYPDFTLRDPDLGPHSPARGPTAVLFPAKDWALVYFGNYGEVLLRREPKFEAFIRRHEYRLLRPDDLTYLVNEAKRDEAAREELAAEIRRKLREDPWTHLRGVLERALAALEKNHGTAN